MKMPKKSGAALLSLILAACSTPNARPPADVHLAAKDQAPPAGNIPEPVQKTLAIPKPSPAGKTETYSVVVNNVPVHDLLFALARDARVNVDIHPGINGNVTLNAIDQTLPQLLDRIARQLPDGMRWEMDGPNVTIMPDLPVLRTYRVDYVNMSRETSGSMAITSQIASGLPGGQGGGGAGGIANNSSTTVKNAAKNDFWETLVQNLRDLLRETDKLLPCDPEQARKARTPSANLQQASSQQGASSAAAGGTSATGQPSSVVQVQLNASREQIAGAECNYREAASVIASAESGIISVRASARQHERVQEFLDKVMTSARRQVMIEATIVEVQLAHQYQQGIDWGRIRTSSGSGASIAGRLIDGAGTISGTNSGLLTITGNEGLFTSTLRLLETFGNIKVLSSPKISVINNQTAILKVVDNIIYFTVKTETTQNANNTDRTVTTTPNSIPVGFVMNVTPQISDNNTVLLNVRPSISRILGFERDPNPDLAAAGQTNRIPIVRSREMESVMLVENGNVAVLGGLMEDSKQNNDSGVPWFHDIPLIGALFTQRDDQVRKTELVIFLRPVIVNEASVVGDYRHFRDQLPVADFFDKDFSPPRYQLLPSAKGDRQ
jgi:general secretion pathway protein D